MENAHTNSLCKNLFIIFSLSRRVKPNGVIMVAFFLSSDCFEYAKMTRPIWAKIRWLAQNGHKEKTNLVDTFTIIFVGSLSVVVSLAKNEHSSAPITSECWNPQRNRQNAETCVHEVKVNPQRRNQYVLTVWCVGHFEEGWIWRLMRYFSNPDHTLIKLNYRLRILVYLKTSRGRI